MRGPTSFPQVFRRSRAELADAAYQALLQLSARKALGVRLRSFTGLLRGFKVGASSDGSLELLIYSPDYGQVDFTVPKFSPFMRRRYPLRDGAKSRPL